MATGKTKQAAEVEESSTSETEEATEKQNGKQRGRSTEPFTHGPIPALSITLPFHDSLDESTSGGIVADVLAAVNEAVTSRGLDMRRFTRGDPSPYRQTLKIAPDGYDWPEPGDSKDRGKRLDADETRANDEMAETVLGLPMSELIKKTGKTQKALWADAQRILLERFQRTAAQS